MLQTAAAFDVRRCRAFSMLLAVSLCHFARDLSSSIKVSLFRCEWLNRFVWHFCKGRNLILSFNTIVRSSLFTLATLFVVVLLSKKLYHDSWSGGSEPGNENKLKHILYNTRTIFSMFSWLRMERLNHLNCATKLKPHRCWMVAQLTSISPRLMHCVKGRIERELLERANSNC